jgi:peroxiredoxin
MRLAARVVLLLAAFGPWAPAQNATESNITETDAPRTNTIDPGAAETNAPKTSATETLGRSAEAHRALHSFEASGILTSRVTRAGLDYNLRWPVSMAQADATLLPAGSPVPILSPLLRFGRIDLRDAAGKPAARDIPGPRSPKGWSLFDQIDQGARQVRRLSDKPVVLDGQAVDCWVLEVDYEPGYPSRALSGQPIRYWIHPHTLLVAAVSFALQDTVGNPPALWVFTAHAVRANERPPQWALGALTQLAGQEHEAWLGRPAPEFSLPDIDGRQVRLSELRGKAVLLSFWASWCVPCKEEMPLLEKLQAEWESAGLEVLGITNESASKARAWLDQQGFDLKTLVDVDRRAFQDYEADQIPVSVVVDRAGNVVSYLQGLGGEAHFRAAVEKALAQQPPNP